MKKILFTLTTLSALYNGYQYVILNKKDIKISKYEKQTIETNQILSELDSLMNMENKDNEVVVAETPVIQPRVYKHDSILKYTGTTNNIHEIRDIIEQIESSGKNVCNGQGYCGYFQFNKYSWKDANRVGLKTGVLKRKIPYKKLKNTRKEQLLMEDIRIKWLATSYRPLNGTFKDEYCKHQLGGGGYGWSLKVLNNIPIVKGKDKNSKRLSYIRKMKTVRNMVNNMGSKMPQFIAGMYHELWQRYTDKLLDIYYSNNHTIPSHLRDRAFKEACIETGIYKYIK